jgi:hypothetical protein
MASINIAYLPADNTTPTGFNRVKLGEEEEFLHDLSEGVIDQSNFKKTDYKIDWDGEVPSLRKATPGEIEAVTLPTKKQAYQAQLLEYYQQIVSGGVGSASMLPEQWITLALATTHPGMPAGVKTRIQEFTEYLVRVLKSFYIHYDNLEAATTLSELRDAALAAKSAINSAALPPESLRDIVDDLPMP